MKKVLRFLPLLMLSVLMFSATTVEAASVSIIDINPSSSVSANTPITFQIDTSGFATTPRYTLSDSLPGSTLSNSNISTSGRFNWTPNALDIGTHEIIFTVSDTYGNKSTLAQTLTIRPVSPLTIESLSPGSSVFSGNSISFSVAALGFSNPSFSLTDSFAGSSLSSGNISSYGVMNWRPTANDVGVHNITVYISAAGGRTDSVSQTITVNGVAIKNLSSNSVTVGTPISFSIAAYGLNSPSYRIGDSLGNNTISSDNLTGNNFNWIPKTQDIGTHTISIYATDANGVASETKVIIQVSDTSSGSSPSSPNTPIYIPYNSQNTSSSQTQQNTSSSSFIFTKALSLGSKGAEVIELQKRLKAGGYYTGPINGSFGPLTKTAVMKYQKAKGLSQLGNVGPGTRAALNKK